MVKDSTEREPVTEDDVQVEADSISPEKNPSKKIWFWASMPWIVSVLIGSTVGAGVFTFEYGNGFSYLSDASETCANCHIMQDHYDAWVKSTHQHVAKCNDCHAPHDFVGKWVCKGRNGLLHSLAFTTQNFHEPIMIHDYNRGIVEANCRYCHSDLIHSADSGVSLSSQEPLQCIRCHQDVGHPK